jgi:hypothetical protein
VNVYLIENGKQLPGDLLMRWVLRSDLAPVPRTLEMTVRLIDGIETDLAVGKSVWTGRENLEYEILWSRRDPPTGQLQGGKSVQTYRVIAALASCSGVAKPRTTPIIATHQTIGSMYRSSGAKVAVAADMAVERFSCLAGQAASYPIAMACQEECAALILTNKQLYVKRLPDLFKQAPIDDIGQIASTGHTQSDFLEKHQVPSFYSTAPDGSTVNGSNDPTRRSIYVPRKTERVLRNLGRVLLRRHIIDSQLAQEISAGDLLTVNGENVVVMTAAHFFDHSLEGAINSNSRFWCGVLSS